MLKAATKLRQLEIPGSYASQSFDDIKGHDGLKGHDEQTGVVTREVPKKQPRKLAPPKPPRGKKPHSGDISISDSDSLGSPDRGYYGSSVKYVKSPYDNVINPDGTRLIYPEVDHELKSPQSKEPRYGEPEYDIPSNDSNSDATDGGGEISKRRVKVILLFLLSFFHL